jgi:hypothetical protein
LGKDSLVYGSADAGRTVHAKNPDFNEAMRRAAKALNLRSHYVGRAGNTIELHSAVDIGLSLSLSLPPHPSFDHPLDRGPHWIRQPILSS